jgi:hypothetical protein
LRNNSKSPQNIQKYAYHAKTVAVIQSATVEDTQLTVHHLEDETRWKMEVLQDLLDMSKL